MRRDQPPPSSPRICNRQPVLLESFCRKQSAYWRVWRTRWLVLTPDTLLCYRYKRGYALGHKPTESFSLRTCGTVRGIDQIAADRGPAFSLCASGAYQAAWLLLAAAERPVVLDFVLADSRLGGQHDSEEMRWLRNTWATEVVNARLLLQTCNSAYSAPNFHAFEPSNVRHALLEPCGVQPCSSDCGHVPQRLRLFSDPNPTPTPNQVRFEERYCSGKVIGAGAFSTVHSATCLQTGRLVAVKRVAKLRLSSRETERLNSEVTILRKCRHPHVVALINHFETPATTRADTCPGACVRHVLIARTGLLLRAGRTEGSGRLGPGEARGRRARVPTPCVLPA